MINIKSDSRKVKEGDTFIAIKNVVRDGHDYIESAIKNGAKKIICEHGNYPVETIIVDDTRKYLNEYLYDNYYPKFKDITLIGVTGTNGKTTTCYMVYQMLRELGKKCAYIGTIGFYCNGNYKPLENTTPDTDLLYELFLEAKDNGCEYVVMEVSSHALSMNRIYGLEYDEVAFTNITQDHLDYHKTMENYIEAKKILFNKTRNKKIAVINSDVPDYENFVLDRNKNVFVGKNSKDIKILNYNLTHQNTMIDFMINDKEYTVNINVVGLFNVYNYLTALALVYKLGFDIDDILKISNKINMPSGRMEKIDYKTNSIFIDYAHTPDAVLNVLNAAKELKVKHIYTIVGCGGDRDRTKRPIMGNIATENSDYVIFSDDNPRTEDHKVIMDDITKDLHNTNYEIIYDRREAIKKGISLLKEHDVLMLLGKGHETYQIIGTEKTHFSDKEEVLKNLEG